MTQKRLANGEAQLPLSRMATISNPSFWLFIGICFVLYIYNKITTPDIGNITNHALANTLTIAAAFITSLLNLLAGKIKNPRIARFFMVACYVFEIGSVVCLGMLIGIQ